MTYLNLNVLDKRPNWKTVRDGRVDGFTYSSQAQNKATPWLESELLRRTVRLPYLCESKTELKALRYFQQQQAGRLLSFWLPMWVADLRVSADVASGTAITIEGQEYHARFQSGLNMHKHLAIITWNKMELYGVSSTATAGANTTVTLDRALDTALDASETVVCPLLLVRFQNDDIEWTYHQDSLAEVNLKFIEVPAEYPAAGGDGSLTAWADTRPLWLFRLTSASGTVLGRWTDWPVDLTDGSLDVWSAANIDMRPARKTMGVVDEPLQMDFTTDDSTNPFRSYVDRLHTAGDRLEVFKADASDDPVTIGTAWFDGVVDEVTFGDAGLMEITALSILRASNRRCPRMKTSRLCNHRLGDDNCAVDLDAIKTTGTVASASAAEPPYIVSTAVGTKQTAESDVHWFTFGRVVINGKERVVIGAETGGKLYLNAPVPGLVGGETVVAYPGCDKRVATCNAKFANLANFIGFPYLPNTEPQFEALTVPPPSGGKKG